MISLAQAVRYAALLAPLYLGEPALAQEPPRAPHVIELEALYSEPNIVDVAIAPSGRRLAVIGRADGIDTLLTIDLSTNERTVLRQVPLGEAGDGWTMKMSAIHWKSDERVLLRTRVLPEGDWPRGELSTFGDRLYSIGLDGDLVGLMRANRSPALRGAFNLGVIASVLPKDPEHIVLVVNGTFGRSLFKVNVATGEGEQIQPASRVAGWWLDADGTPVVQTHVENGMVHLSRKDEAGQWRVFHRMRVPEVRDRQGLVGVGASSDPRRYYVLTRSPSRDRFGLYLLDLESGQLGEPLIEHPTYDLVSARVARDGSGISSYCYTVHVRICEFTDPTISQHMVSVRRFFGDSTSVHVTDASQDGRTILLYVEGPQDAPAYYYYRAETREIRPIGALRSGLNGAQFPRSSVVQWAARDGKELTGYLTVPESAGPRDRLPLVVYPHGGPESRDYLTFDPRVQYLASRGYAVFQPNFRGSDGFGRAFAESGYGEWGRKMQDDIMDGVMALIDSGAIDEARICIVGASYGGYAALVAAALTPETFQCAISMAGISDLEEFINWRKRNWGVESEGYMYWLEAIGDPQEQPEKLAAVSPVRLADRISIPLLLIHGTDDRVVPFSQSRALRKALGRSMLAELIELDDEGHLGWSAESEMRTLRAIDRFLGTYLGPGHPAPPAG